MSPSAVIAAARPSPPTVQAAARAGWTGRLVLGPLTTPVKAYPAVVVPSHGPLHQIHVGCGERVSQRRVCSKHGELAAAEIGKAFEYGPNEQLPISEEELDSLLPEDDHAIQIEHLLPADRFEASLLSGRSLYLAPAHPAAEPDFAQAVVVLGNRNVWAVGRMILSEQRRAVAVRAEDRQLLLYILHWPEHRRAYPGADLDTASVSSSKLRALEKALLPLHKSFAWEEYRDEGAATLNALIAKKIAERNSQPATTVPKRVKPTTAVGTTAPRSRRAA